MKPFLYRAVSSLAEATGVLSEYGDEAKVIAGGTDLLVEFRRSSSNTPRVIVDVSRVPELRGIVNAQDVITIKPLTTHTQVEFSDTVHRHATLLSSAASTIGSVQIRNRGTIGGNIMNAAPCADTVPPLIALGAMVTLQSESGCREIDLQDLFLNPYHTAARPDELLTGIRFRSLGPDIRSAFVKLGRRNALAISRLSIAAALQTGKDGRIVDARIVPGSAFPTWSRATSAEEILIGEKPSRRLFVAAGNELAAAMIRETGRRWSTEYKEPVISVLVRRALDQCVMHSTLPMPPHADHTTHSVAVTSRRRMSGSMAITTTVNGRAISSEIPANRTVVEFLRDDLGLTGTKTGCEIGECGACTVLIDGQAVNSCLVLAVQADGRSVTTVEGLQTNGTLHPLQASFMDHDAVHCGFCTPGMLMSARALLDGTPHPSETEIRTAISGNLCRCTGYVQIVEAVKKAANT
jgi:xanthine dehydrogenase iron-sulfur cluster and FAD-binding subunit A